MSVFSLMKTILLSTHTMALFHAVAMWSFPVESCVVRDRLECQRRGRARHVAFQAGSRAIGVWCARHGERVRRGDMAVRAAGAVRVRRLAADVCASEAAECSHFLRHKQTLLAPY